MNTIQGDLKSGLAAAQDQATQIGKRIQQDVDRKCRCRTMAHTAEAAKPHLDDSLTGREQPVICGAENLICN
jgi:hypothetical protein